ncbi:DUF6685 family protein [Pseudomonas sp. WCS374]|uniref:DUF6685 family protein n=1 Tax=Pseudomonas sp. WCS374 TaxID=1495331 RepID=UPI00049AF543|nr:DUF6685 family protein [Pseudomonas sp. WCS374]AIB42830.1 hypothetical protein PD374_17450 [Pseudomonas sp. WCS374]
MLSKAVKFLRNSLLEDCGYPATLVNLLREDSGLNRHLVEHDKGIGAYEIVHWNEFGNLLSEDHFHRQRLSGWTRCPHSYRNYGSTNIVREDLLSLGTVTEQVRWSCEIQEVGGFGASKSELQNFKSMDAMVERNSQEMITPVTKEKLEENLRWDEIRIISREKTTDHFATWEWDGKVFLINGGGSHHFAAAKYIARLLGIKVPLSGRYVTYGINQVAVASLRRDFDMFVMSWTTDHHLAFHKAMQSFEATYYWKALPRPYTDQCAIFLPKAEKRSAKIAQVLHEAGFQDLGKYLKSLSDRQA